VEICSVNLDSPVTPEPMLEPKSPSWRIGHLDLPATKDRLPIPGVRSVVQMELWCDTDARAENVKEFEQRRVELLSQVEVVASKIRSEEPFIRLSRLEDQRVAEEQKLANAKIRGEQMKGGIRDALVAGNDTDQLEHAAREAAADASIAEHKLSVLQELLNEAEMVVNARRREVRAEARKELLARLQGEGVALEQECAGLIADYAMRLFAARQMCLALNDEIHAADIGARRAASKRRQRLAQGLSVDPVDPSEPFFKEPIAIRLRAGGDAYGNRPRLEDE
jgi:hypothetical protein